MKFEIWNNIVLYLKDMGDEDFPYNNIFCSSNLCACTVRHLTFLPSNQTSSLGMIFKFSFFLLICHVRVRSPKPTFLIMWERNFKELLHVINTGIRLVFIVLKSSFFKIWSLIKFTTSMCLSSITDTTRRLFICEEILQLILSVRRLI